VRKNIGYRSKSNYGELVHLLLKAAHILFIALAQSFYDFAMSFSLACGKITWSSLCVLQLAEAYDRIRLPALFIDFRQPVKCLEFLRNGGWASTFEQGGLGCLIAFYLIY